jgi:hypothetical protein
VRVNDFVNVGGGYVAVPNCVRIDDEIGTVLALIKTAGLVGANSVL